MGRQRGSAPVFFLRETAFNIWFLLCHYEAWKTEAPHFQAEIVARNRLVMRRGIWQEIRDEASWTPTGIVRANGRFFP